jgi:hypothetical protein
MLDNLLTRFYASFNSMTYGWNNKIISEDIYSLFCFKLLKTSNIAQSSEGLKINAAYLSY